MNPNRSKSPGSTPTYPVPDPLVVADHRTPTVVWNPPSSPNTPVGSSRATASHPFVQDFGLTISDRPTSASDEEESDPPSPHLIPNPAHAHPDYRFRPGDRPLEDVIVLKPIGRGGFGEVYHAVSEAGRELALKYVSRNFEIERRGVTRCMNLKCPHLVTIFDVKRNAAGQWFVLMEYVAGPSLESQLNQHPNGLPRQEILRWMDGLATGVDFLHRAGIVHRDLKPANLFWDEGTVKIGDYGLAKQIHNTRTAGRRGHRHSEVIGTCHYMAPEIGKGDYSHRVDIYAMGVILYEMLTGRVPFHGETQHEVIQRHLCDLPDLEPIPEEYRDAVARALHKIPKRRPETARQLVEAIRISATPSITPASPPEIVFVIEDGRLIARPSERPAPDIDLVINDQGQLVSPESSLLHQELPLEEVSNVATPPLQSRQNQPDAVPAPAASSPPAPPPARPSQASPRYGRFQRTLPSMWLSRWWSWARTHSLGLVWRIVRSRSRFRANSSRSHIADRSAPVKSGQENDSGVPSVWGWIGWFGSRRGVSLGSGGRFGLVTAGWYDLMPALILAPLLCGALVPPGLVVTGTSLGEAPQRVAFLALAPLTAAWIWLIHAGFGNRQAHHPLRSLRRLVDLTVAGAACGTLMAVFARFTHLDLPDLWHFPALLADVGPWRVEGTDRPSVWGFLAYHAALFPALGLWNPTGSGRSKRLRWGPVVGAALVSLALGHLLPYPEPWGLLPAVGVAVVAQVVRPRV